MSFEQYCRILNVTSFILVFFFLIQYNFRLLRYICVIFKLSNDLQIFFCIYSVNVLKVRKLLKFKKRIKTLLNNNINFETL